MNINTTIAENMNFYSHCTYMYLHIVLLKTHWRLINETITLLYYDNEFLFLLKS